MAAYMYPITIDRNPKTISYCEEIKCQDDWFTIAMIRKYAKDDEIFHIRQLAERNEGYLLVVFKHRMETPAETASRVAKEESYMRNYEAHQKKHKK